MENDGSARAQRIFKTRQGAFSYYTEADKGYLIRTDDIQKRFEPALADVKTTVAADLYETKAQDNLQERVQRAFEAAKNKTLKEVQSEFGGTLKTISKLSPTDETEIEKLQKDGLPINTLFQLEMIGAVAFDLGTEKGIVMRLDEVEPFDEAAFMQHKDALKAQLYTQRRQLVLEGFIASLQRNATINVSANLSNLRQNYE
jgi:hypothetical protein